MSSVDASKGHDVRPPAATGAGDGIRLYQTRLGHGLWTHFHQARRTGAQAHRCPCAAFQADWIPQCPERETAHRGWSGRRAWSPPAGILGVTVLSSNLFVGQGRRSASLGLPPDSRTDAMAAVGRRPRDSGDPWSQSRPSDLEHLLRDPLPGAAPGDSGRDERPCSNSVGPLQGRTQPQSSGRHAEGLSSNGVPSTCCWPTITRWRTPPAHTAAYDDGSFHAHAVSHAFTVQSCPTLPLWSSWSGESAAAWSFKRPR